MSDGKELEKDNKPKKRKLTKAQVSSYKGGLEREGYTIIPPEYLQCTRCLAIKSVPNRNYYKSRADIHKGHGYIPICRSCLDEMHTRIMKDNELDEKLSLYYLLMELNMPWSERLWLSVKGKKSKLGKYLGTLNGMVHYLDLTFHESDVFIVETEDMTEDDIEEAIQANTRGDLVLDADKLKELRSFWGKSYSNEELVWLENEYTRWLTNHVSEEYSQKISFKGITRKMLDIKRKVDKGESVDDDEKTLQSMMKTANVQPLTMKNTMNSDGGNRFGMVIKDIEQNEPAEFFEKIPLYEDFDDLAETYKTEIERPLRNLLTGSRDFDPNYSLKDEE